MKRVFVIALLWALPLLAQSNRGELRLTVTDPSGLGVKATVQISSEANQYRNTLTTSDSGTLNVQRLSYGIYQLTIEQPGFAPVSESVDIHSSHTPRVPHQAESGGGKRVGDRDRRKRRCSIPIRRDRSTKSALRPSSAA